MKELEVLKMKRQEKENNTEVYCKACETTKYGRDFYKRLVKNAEGITISSNGEPIVKLEGELVGICKDCFMKEYFKYLDENNGDTKKSIYILCKKYELPFDGRHVDMLLAQEKSCSSVLKTYIKDIQSLHMYNVSFDEYVMKDSSTKVVEESKKEIDKDVLKNVKEKSDSDFINEDIKRIKINIENASKGNDVNGHGKWLNSLRDALELREKLNK